MSPELARRERSIAATPAPEHGVALEIILSFDVEEHFRIEAATGLDIAPSLKAQYAGRVEPTTRWLLDRLEDYDIRATFFIIGQLAPSRGADPADPGSWTRGRQSWLGPSTHPGDDSPRLPRRCPAKQGGPRAGHGHASRGLSRADVQYPAIDGVGARRARRARVPLRFVDLPGPPRPIRRPASARMPFWARGFGHKILEFPPATLRMLGTNLPVGGGGYFRLLPLSLMERALEQTRRTCRPAVTMLYFHPWEFDPEQPRLPLGHLGRFRTYVGIKQSRERLGRLLARHRFSRGIDLASRLALQPDRLLCFGLDDGALESPAPCQPDVQPVEWDRLATNRGIA